MKKLGKLNFNPEKLIKGEELQKLLGGDLHYSCCCWYCMGCAPTCGSAWIPEGVNPDSWAAQQGGYESCSCIGGY
jgi:hypothetical protein